MSRIFSSCDSLLEAAIKEDITKRNIPEEEQYREAVFLEANIARTIRVSCSGQLSVEPGHIPKTYMFFHIIESAEFIERTENPKLYRFTERAITFKNTYDKSRPETRPPWRRG